MMKRLTLLLLFALWLLAACRGRAADQPTPSPATPALPPTATATTALPTPTPTRVRPADPAAIDFINVAIDVPDRSGVFSNFDAFGNVIGIDAAMMQALAQQGAFAYELLVTGFDGMLASVANGEIDAAIAAIDRAQGAPDGVVFTQPYLEVGQVLVVRANETEIASWRDLTAEMQVALVGGTAGETAARAVVGLPETVLLRAATPTEALQALSDFQVRAAIVDSFDGTAYTDRYYQRIKLATDEPTISAQQYVIAVAADNPALLQKLNMAIDGVRAGGGDRALAIEWLAADAPLAAGDSLIGTPDDRLIVGVVGALSTFDPAQSEYNPTNWEIQFNTQSGLLRYDSANRLQPALAAALPTISADGLIYTFTLRDDLVFADGTRLTAALMAQSLRRSVTAGNRLLNAYLKDGDVNGFADDDAIQALGDYELQFVLGAPLGYFASLLATPPYAPINPQCDAATFNPLANCDGIGPYRVEGYDPGVSVRLIANPDWPLEPPAVARVEVRFYAGSAALRDALANEAIDVAWRGLAPADLTTLAQQAGLTRWPGPGVFKSYLVLEQSQPPFDDVRVRQALAYAVDREALAQTVFEGQRLPLYSPLPAEVPGAVASQPPRDLAQATALLSAAGYNQFNPLEFDLWYLNDGRYTPRERAYAEALEAQLEETGAIEVTLNGEAWATYSVAMSGCQYPAFLLGWPPAAQRFLEGMTWISHFIYNASVVCSNYASAQMDALMTRLLATTDEAQRLAVYGEIQALWATELPTLDLTQETLDAVTLDKVSNVVIDALGILHYDRIGK